MTAAAFPLPVLPADAFRRTWLVDQCVNAATGQRFLKILRALSPLAARTVQGKAWHLVFVALLQEVGELFPTWEPVIFENEDLDEYLYAGIPIEPQGCHYEMGGCALEISLLTLNPSYLTTLDDCDTLKDKGHLAWARSWWQAAQATDGEKIARQWKLPRGRVLTGVWLAVPDLVRWARGTTGNGWLDYSVLEMDGMENPRWTIEEIRSLARLWKQAKPIHDRIWALLNYVEADVRGRLPLLYDVLRGDPNALAQVTVAKSGQSRAKTLAEVFLGKEKRK